MNESRRRKRSAFGIATDRKRLRSLPGTDIAMPPDHVSFAQAIEQGNRGRFSALQPDSQLIGDCGVQRLDILQMQVDFGSDDEVRKLARE